MPWMMNVSDVESIIEDIERALFASGLDRAVDIVRAKAAVSKEMYAMSGQDLAMCARAELMIVEHCGRIIGEKPC